MSDFFAERNARWERERQERDAALRASGCRLIGCVAYENPRANDSCMSMWSGETETLVITDVDADDLKYGLGCIPVRPGSVVHVNPPNARELALATNGVVLTVFKGRRPT